MRLHWRPGLAALSVLLMALSALGSAQESPALRLTLPSFGPGVDMATSPDGALLAVAGQMTTRVFTANGVPLRDIATGARPMRLAFSPDGRNLAIADDNGFITMARPYSGAIAWQSYLAQVPVGFYFTPDGTTLIYAAQNAYGAMSAHGMPLVEKASVQNIMGAAISTKADLLALVGEGTTGYPDCTVISLPSFNVKYTLPSLGWPNAGSVGAFSPDNRALYVANSDGAVKRWTFGSSVPANITMDTGALTSDIAVRKDNAQLMFGTEDLLTYVAVSTGAVTQVPTAEFVTDVSYQLPWGTATVVACVGATPTWFQGNVEKRRLESYALPILGFSWGLSQTDLTIVAGEGAAKIDGFSGQTISHLPTPVSARSAAISQDGTMEALGLSDGTIQIRQPSDPPGTSSATFGVPAAFQVKRMAFLPGATFLTGFLAAASHDPVLRVWNLASGTVKYEMSPHPAILTTLGAARDVPVVVSADGSGVVRVWSIGGTNASMLFELPTKAASIPSVAVSPDGSRIAVAFGPSVALHNGTTGALIRTYAFGRAVSHVEFMPDGNWLAISGRGVLGLYALVGTAKNLINAFPATLINTQPMAVHPDGRSIVVANGADMKTYANPTQVALSSLVAETLGTPGGQVVRVRAYLTNAALSAGSVITVASDNPYLLAPEFVAVPYLDRFVEFAVYVKPVSLSQTATLTASLDGVTCSIPIQLLPGYIASVAVPSSIPAGTVGTGTVTLDSPAFAYGTRVSLSSSWSGASVPSSVVVPAGQTSTTFPINAGATSVRRAAVITATTKHVYKRATTYVVP